MPFALIPILASLVPEAVKWIAGDAAGKAASTVASIATQVLGTDDPAKVEAAIASDPAKALEFKLAVLAAQSASEKEETARILAEHADRQSARLQTVNLAQAGSAIAWGAPVVSVLVTAGFFAMLYLVLTREIPEGSQRLADIMLGWLGASFAAVVAYWVGSSAGSAAKTATLEKVLTNR